MNANIRRRVLIAALVGSGCVAAASGQEYTITDIGVLKPSDPNAISIASGISDQGFVIGTGYPGINAAVRPFYYRPSPYLNPGITEYGTYYNGCQNVLGTTISQFSNQISGMKQVVCGGEGIAYLLGNNGTPRSLDSIARLAGGYDSFPASVTETGYAVGWSNTRCCFYGWASGNPIHAVTMGRGRPAVRIPDLGGLQSYATGIGNYSGWIVGFGNWPDSSALGSTGAFLYGALQYEYGPSVHPLPTLGGSNARAYGTAPTANFICGWSQTTSGVTRATFWDSDLTAYDVGTLPGRPASAANAVNDGGYVVGNSGPDVNWNLGAEYLPDADTHAFISYKGVMRDLNDLVPANSGWVLRSAVGINSCGWIAGNGTFNGKARAFMLKPCTPTITTQPAHNVVSCFPDGMSFYISVCSPTPVTYHWRRNGVPLTEGGVYSNVLTNELTIEGVDPNDNGEYDCVVTNSCGSVISMTGSYHYCFCYGVCPADFNADGGVDGADVNAFFAKWEAGDCLADVNADGGVDGGDVGVFFAAWESGGC
jgi:uncharacterized membrane protein